MKFQAMARNILLAFALLSLGFFAGKEHTLRSVRPGQAVVPAAGEDKVIVYYLHGTIRCITCNRIEKQARETIQRQFADELQAGTLEWRAVNFQEDDDLARRYDVTSSSIVLVRLAQGRETAIRRLDGVWKLVDQPPAFSIYIAGEVGALLEDRR
jgi:hypothetical protein